MLSGGKASFIGSAGELIRYTLKVDKGKLNSEVKRSSFEAVDKWLARDCGLGANRDRFGRFYYEFSTCGILGIRPAQGGAKRDRILVLTATNGLTWLEGERTRGEFGGVGINIAIRDGWLTIVSPIYRSPAYKAGLKAGDKILEIDGESTRGITMMEAVRQLRGPEGTRVTVVIARAGLHETQDLIITRGIVKTGSGRSRKRRR